MAGARGAWRGRVHMAEDFNELPPDIARALGADAPPQLRGRHAESPGMADELLKDRRREELAEEVRRLAADPADAEQRRALMADLEALDAELTDPFADEAQRDLDGIPGASERAREGAKQAAEGKTVPLDALDDPAEDPDAAERQRRRQRQQEAMGRAGRLLDVDESLRDAAWPE